MAYALIVIVTRKLVSRWYPTSLAVLVRTSGRSIEVSTSIRVALELSKVTRGSVVVV